MNAFLHRLVVVGWAILDRLQAFLESFDDDQCLLETGVERDCGVRDLFESPFQVETMLGRLRAFDERIDRNVRGLGFGWDVPGVER